MTAFVLILLGVLSRLVPHPPNAVAMGAMALYAGARLPRRWALAVPVVAMLLSDFILDYGTGRGLLSPVRLTSYATFAVIVLLGRLPRRDAGPLVRVEMSLGASLLFFLTTNLAVWQWGELYPRTAHGLVLCYEAAVPFFGNTLSADLVGTALLFGCDALIRQRLSQKKPALSLGTGAAAAPGSVDSRDQV
jgi:uncharacterized protein DUF6580